MHLFTIDWPTSFELAASSATSGWEGTFNLLLPCSLRKRDFSKIIISKEQIKMNSWQTVDWDPLDLQSPHSSFEGESTIDQASVEVIIIAPFMVIIILKG